MASTILLIFWLWCSLMIKDDINKYDINKRYESLGIDKSQ